MASLAMLLWLLASVVYIPRHAEAAESFSQDNTISVNFDHVHPLHKVFDSYLSFNIDTGSLYHNMDFTNKAFINLVANLQRAAPSQVYLSARWDYHLLNLISEFRLVKLTLCD